jgi:hypothetical protein
LERELSNSAGRALGMLASLKDADVPAALTGNKLLKKRKLESRKQEVSGRSRISMRMLLVESVSRRSCGLRMATPEIAFKKRCALPGFYQKTRLNDITQII